MNKYKGSGASAGILSVLGFWVIVFCVWIVFVSGAEKVETVESLLSKINAYPADVVIVHVYGREETSPGNYASYLKARYTQSRRAGISGAVKTTKTYKKAGGGWTVEASVVSVEASKYEL